MGGRKFRLTNDRAHGEQVRGDDEWIPNHLCAGHNVGGLIRVRYVNRRLTDDKKGKELMVDACLFEECFILVQLQ